MERKKTMRLISTFALSALFLICTQTTAVESYTDYDSPKTVLRTFANERLQQDQPPVLYPVRHGAEARDSLEDFINTFMGQRHIAGLSACISKNGETIWSGTFGTANFEHALWVEEGTLFMLASISKTVTCTALMQLWEQGMFALDDAVNQYLPFSVIHPDFPDTEITFRMILTHTSGIKDNWDVMFYFPGDSPLYLGDYLDDYFTPGGAYYDPNKSFTNNEPGTQFVYSNIALALAGHLVETISGVPLEDHCQEHIFGPLGMDNTSFFLANLDPMDIAMPYHWNGSVYVPYGHFGYTDYPAGQLRTSAPQLMSFLTTFMKDIHPFEPAPGGNHASDPSGSVMTGQASQLGFIQNGGNPPLEPRLLKRSTVEMILTPQYPQVYSSIGLVWFKGTIGARTVWGHGGGDQGVSTQMHYCPESEIGVIVLTNGESGLNPVLVEMFDYGDAF